MKHNSLLELLVVAGFYILLAGISLSLRQSTMLLPPLWLPIGFSMALCLGRKRSLWPGLWLGAFSVWTFLYLDPSTTTSMIMSLIAAVKEATIETVLVVLSSFWLLHGQKRGTLLNSVSTNVRFGIIAILALPLVVATVGSITRSSLPYVSGIELDIHRNYLTYALGIVALTPLLRAIENGVKNRSDISQLERVGAWVLFVALFAGSFHPVISLHSAYIQYGSVALLILWSIVRQGQLAWSLGFLGVTIITFIIRNMILHDTSVIGSIYIRQILPLESAQLILLSTGAAAILLCGLVIRYRSLEQLVRSSEAHFKRVAHSSRAVLYRYKIGTPANFTYMSPAIYDVTGYKPHDFQVDPGLSGRLLHSSDRLLFERALTDPELMEVPIVMRWVHKNGDTIWTEQHMVPIYDRHGALISVEGTVRDITDQRMMKKDLQYRLDIEQLISHVTARFVYITPEQFDSTVNETLQSVGEFAEVDRCYVFLYRDNGQMMDNTHEWVSPGITAEMGNLQNVEIDTFPWWNKKIRDQQPIVINRVADLPPEAELEIKEFEAEHIQSIIGVPLTCGGKLKGFVGMDAVREEMEWSDDVLMLLGQVAESIASAVEQIQAGEILMRYRETNKTIRETSKSLILTLNSEGVIMELNESCMTMLGYRSADMLGKPIEKYMSSVDVDPIYTILGDVLAGRPVRDFQCHLIHRNRDFIGVSINASLLQTGEKHPPTIILIFDLMSAPESYQGKQVVGDESLSEHCISG